MFPKVSVFLWKQLFSYNDSRTPLSILGISWYNFLRESTLRLRVWMKHTLHGVFSGPWCSLHLALLRVQIKHQLMHRLSCLFEFKSIFIHTGSWKPLCEHTCPKKCGGRFYLILKVGGTRPPCDLHPRTALVVLCYVILCYIILYVLIKLFFIAFCPSF